MSAPILDVQNVTRNHGSGEARVEALRGVSLQVSAGELVAVMGPSGSGKSTLLTIAGGLLSPTSGDVRIEQQSLSGLSAKNLAKIRRRRVGFVFQELNLIPALTVLENVALPLELDGVRTAKAAKAALQMLETMGLDGVAERFPEDLSGGQQQRVAIARGLVGERRLLLADEPTGALDTRTGEDVMKLLRQRCDAGAAGVLVTHDSRNAAWADRVVFVRDGEMVHDANANSTPESVQ